MHSEKKLKVKCGKAGRSKERKVFKTVALSVRYWKRFYTDSFLFEKDLRQNITPEDSSLSKYRVCVTMLISGDKQ